MDDHHEPRVKTSLTESAKKKLQPDSRPPSRQLAKKSLLIQVQAIM